MPEIREIAQGETLRAARALLELRPQRAPAEALAALAAGREATGPLLGRARPARRARRPPRRPARRRLSARRLVRAGRGGRGRRRRLPGAGEPRVGSPPL